LSRRYRRSGGSWSAINERSAGRDPRGCVLEGRDIGSVVFPNADYKFFLTAKPEARAQRRFAEDAQKGRVTTFEHTLAEINERDARDVAARILRSPSLPTPSSSTRATST
jgi:cytidylate kinase